jgi:hypothetical protein
MRLEGLDKLKKKINDIGRKRVYFQSDNWNEILDESSSDVGVVSREELYSPWS